MLALRFSPGLSATPLMMSSMLRALAFTLTYTFVVTPLVIVLGLAIALGVNGLPRLLRGRLEQGALLQR